MDPLLKKLGYRAGTTVTVLAGPTSFRSVIERWETTVEVRNRIRGGSEFLLVFVKTAAQVAARASSVVHAAAPDARIWFAYPKASKRNNPSLNRTEGWESLQTFGLCAVRDVSIDDVWSARCFAPDPAVSPRVPEPLSGNPRPAPAPKVRRPALVAAFLDEVDPSRRELAAAVDETIRSVAPKIEIGRSGRMLGYGPYHYRYASGCEGDSFVVSMMSGAQALSIYVECTENGKYLVDHFASSLGKVSAGKSCIRVKKLEDLNLDTLAELVARAVKSTLS